MKARASSRLGRPALLAAIVAGAVAAPCDRARGEAGPEPAFELRERLWTEANTHRDSRTAPRLLIVYPIDRTRLGVDAGRTRFAGRVDPPDAGVALNGAPLKIWPGGVFTGLLEVPPGENEYAFVASGRGGRTEARRTVIREEPPPPRPTPEGPPPLAFRSWSPVEPTGDHWLRAGDPLPVSLRATGATAAFFRVGDAGAWKPFAGAPEAGAFRGAIASDETVSEFESAPVRFRIEGAGESRELVSELLLRRIPERPAPDGSPARPVFAVNKNLTTFLKEPTGWERFGNWMRGTPFPIRAKLNDRVLADFGRGPAGYVEVAEAVFVGPALPDPSFPLADARVWFGAGDPPTEVALEWPAPHPVAAVFRVEEDAGSGTHRLVADLLGAESIAPAEFVPIRSDFVRRVGLTPPLAAAPAFGIAAPSPGAFPPGGTDPAAEIVRLPPGVAFEFAGRPLWGYGWSVPAPGRLRLVARVRPDPPAATPERPLGGLRIMVDAGHGGEDRGALGPSGLTEADVNLAMSLMLGERLERLGATVFQTRSTDAFVALDDRVDMALARDPHLFVSVHHNSVALDADPLADRGPGVYYHYPHSVPVALAVAEELRDLWRTAEAPRVVEQNFRVNRNVSACPSILVENAFVCHPEDEIRLRDARALAECAEAVARGIVRVFAADAAP